MKIKENTEIVDVRLEGMYLYLSVRTQSIALQSSPGQFVNVRVNDSYTPFLRRPFAVFDVEGDILTMMIAQKGIGTQLLALKKHGELLNIVGPLGNPFPKPSKEPLLVAGGIGIAPFYFFAKGLSRPQLLIGARNRESLPNLAAFESVCRVRVATDDGSVGIKGTVADLIREFDLMRYTVYACGPTPMFKALTKLLRERSDNPEVYYSLETKMACGFGVCKGCAVETTGGGIKLCCSDGPSFRWDEVSFAE